MKKIYALLILITITTSTNAQITEGNWLVGGNVGFSYSESKPASFATMQTFTVQLSPNVGYFIWDKFALGTKVDYTYSSSRSETGTSRFERFLATPFVKYYLLNTYKMVNPFLESAYGFSIINEASLRQFSVKGGAAVFLNDSVAFEVSLSYLNSTSKNMYNGSHTFLLGFGVQVHLKKL